jgi:hypothetical protein
MQTKTDEIVVPLESLDLEIGDCVSSWTGDARELQDVPQKIKEQHLVLLRIGHTLKNCLP